MYMLLRYCVAFSVSCFICASVLVVLMHVLCCGGCVHCFLMFMARDFMFSFSFFAGCHRVWCVLLFTFLCIRSLCTGALSDYNPSHPAMGAVEVALVPPTVYNNTRVLTKGLTMNWNVVGASSLEGSPRLDFQVVYSGNEWYVWWQCGTPNCSLCLVAWSLTLRSPVVVNGDPAPPCFLVCSGHLWTCFRGCLVQDWRWCLCKWYDLRQHGSSGLVKLSGLVCPYCHHGVCHVCKWLYASSSQFQLLPRVWL